MDWNKRIELTFRGYAREHRAIEDTFNDVLGKLSAFGADAVKVSDVETLYVPLADTKVGAAKKAGMLVMEREEGWVVVIRQWIVTIKMDREYNHDGRGVVGTILEKTGPVFTNIRIVTEAFTDVAPQ